ncbi:hypothetical protein Y032_0457g1808 [Ancylostoma ceylanicum]|nr:hypothetical protein Y032_0457g1808 [Ancylostoma ceylanicum]
MALWYAALILLSVAASGGAQGLAPAGIQATPDCSQLGKYAFHRKDLRTELAAELLVRQPTRGGVSAKMTYLCALEGMAGLILENPHKPVTCPVDLGIFPLLFEKDGKDVSANLMTKEATADFVKHMPAFGSATGFGCNYVEENGRHKFLCLFKLTRKIVVRRS